MEDRAVIFDLDGTLLNTLDDIADSMNNVLHNFGFPQHDRESYKLFIGDGMGNLVIRALPQDKTEDPSFIEQCVVAMRREYQIRWAMKTKVYPKIPELLTFLHTHNFKMAVYSNKPDDFTKLMVSRFLPHWTFKQVVGSRPEKPLKPDPTVAKEIAANISVAPSQVIYLGDTGTDMKTALAAGMFPVGVTWGFRSGDELEQNGAAVLIEDPMELASLL